MKSKIFIILFLLFFITINFYFSQANPDEYTQSKIRFSSLTGSTSYLGRLDLWHLLVQAGDWDKASLIETQLNQDQVIEYKQRYQPQELSKRITQLEINNPKTADDYIELAKSQSLLGLNLQAIKSIKTAHQLDPVRSDIGRLFYQITQ